jgi:beta-galactosidase
VADWNWKGHEGRAVDVDVYSSCEEAELFLNGKSLGRKPTNRSTEFKATWAVPYQPGTLKAVGYGKTPRTAAATAELRTADAPSRIKLTADRARVRADGQDLSYVTVELVDARGVRHPKAENLVRFSVEGPGSIVGVGNANPVSTESYQQPQRKAWQGRALVVVKSGTRPGRITLRAASQGLPTASLVIEAGGQ